MHGPRSVLLGPARGGAASARHPAHRGDQPRASFLQHHEKAVIVGEKTIGGTHPVVLVRVHSNFAIAVPVSMPVYPAGLPTSPLNRPVYPDRAPDTTGTPVVPDIEAPANQALKTAHIAALTRLIETDPERAGELQPVIEKLRTN